MHLSSVLPSFGLGLVLQLGLVSSVSAITIGYSLTALGGDDYRYDYTVINDGSLGPDTAIELFSILFDTQDYDEASLSIVSTDVVSAAWGELLLGSGVGLPAAYDALSGDGGIGVNELLFGFAVEFRWIGGVAGPGRQVFEVFDPDSFDLLETGSTTLVPLAVSEFAMHTLSHASTRIASTGVWHYDYRVTFESGGRYAC